MQHALCNTSQQKLQTIKHAYLR